MPDTLTKKLFGVALDASDDPMSLQLKWASMMAGGGQGRHFHVDPYEAVSAEMAAFPGVEALGKFPVPTWLGPRPDPADLPSMTLENIRRFYDDQGFRTMSDQIQAFVESEIFPDLPAMIGIDHSATGGVVSALSGRYGPENLSVIVLDRHFDGLVPSVRMAASRAAAGDPSSMPFSQMGADEYCCGSFWSYLLDSGVLLPENLAFIGVADYPRDGMGEGWDSYRRAYLEFEERGCRYFPLWQFEEPYRDRLDAFVDDGVKTSQLYVSFDIDVGSLNSVHAARYMDGPGLSRENITDVASAISRRIEAGATSLAGFDIVEFNMHFLGIETDDGLKDSTLDTVAAFVGMLLGVDRSEGR